MDIQHKTGESKGSFFIEEDGEVQAEITYSKAGNTKIIIDHTEVSDELRGENIGKALVKHAVSYAPGKPVKSDSSMPLCQIGY